MSQKWRPGVQHGLANMVKRSPTWRPSEKNMSTRCPKWRAEVQHGGFWANMTCRRPTWRGQHGDQESNMATFRSTWRVSGQHGDQKTNMAWPTWWQGVQKKSNLKWRPTEKHGNQVSHMATRSPTWRPPDQHDFAPVRIFVLIDTANSIGCTDCSMATLQIIVGGLAQVAVCSTYYI